MSRAFHIAFEDDWEQSVGFGSYEAATRGHPYEPGDYIRATTAEGVQDVLDAHYQDLNISLLLIDIDTAALEASGTRVEREGSAVRIFGPLPCADSSIIAGVLPMRHEHERWVAPDEITP
ncbi:MAG: DUF952 domain-containing protein [Microbacteriaceae bacterium]|jgi:uncharacterized protein (DUF952 family)|nr:DUF952 domain-containing protein [Microbacteriaceae bacterium]HOA86598.1 hypothetical protein [Microbacteriaceae bacterium]HPZ33951.1 hypothetical protein [Microbacteriaceae bacterium]HQC92985.1 hypothetical protein [Microbacteriaceae bacterium]